jgi:hypothetical protein
MSNLKTRVLFGLVGVGALVTTGLAGSLFETNDAGYYQVKQAALTGTMTTHNEAGVYPQLFGSISTYKVSETSYFSDAEGNDIGAVNVRFDGGGTAKISGSIKYRLSSDPVTQLKLHTDFRSFSAVEHDLIRQVVTASLMQTSALFKPDDVYSTRRAEFISVAEEQIRTGIFATESEEAVVQDAEGNESIERTVKVKHDKDGNPIIKTPSAFKQYGIEVIQFVIKELDFDDIIDGSIMAKKQAEQLEVVAKANAEKSKQDFISATEKGKADVAIATAKANVIKETAVIAAIQQTAIEEEKAKQAEFAAKATKAKGAADAYAAKLKVQAGLSPLEQAEIDRDTAIGVAKEMANVKFPQMMVIGGGSGGNGPLNPFDAVGLKSFLDISKGLANGTK